LSALRALRRNFPEIVGRQFRTGYAYAIEREPAGMGFVTGRGGRAHRYADKSRVVNGSYRRHGGIGWPHAGATPTGAPGVTAPSADGAHLAPPVSDGAAAPVFETWRRRIAEEFVHQEGVSL
jgi:hypothetical protein